MKMKWMILFVSVFMFSSCAEKLEFTPTIKNDIELNGEELSKVQYYNAEDIILRRELKSTDIKVKKGIVVIKDGKYVDQIKIAKNTAGIFVKKEGDDKLFIAFEKDSLQYLPFEKPKYYGKYFQLIHDRREGGNYFVNYGGFEYKIIGTSKLLYRPIKRKSVKSDYRTAKGMKVDDSIFNLNKKLKIKKDKAKKTKNKTDE